MGCFGQPERFTSPPSLLQTESRGWRYPACEDAFEVQLSHSSQEKQINVGKLMNYFQVCTDIYSNAKEESHTGEITAETAEHGAQAVNILGL